MNALVIYLLEASICLGVFYLFYLAVLYRQSSFRYNRVYLLATFTLGWVLPLLEIPLGWGGGGVTADSTSAYILLLPTTYSSDTEVAMGSTLLWLGLVYGAGMLFVSVRFAQQLYQLYRAMQRSEWQQVLHRRYRLLYTQGTFPTASFFQYLFWDNTQVLTVEETHQMMAHEEAHIRQGHSYDVLYMSLLKIVVWFHPLVYLYDRALVQVHEYAADAAALQHGAPRAYARLLSKHSLARRKVLLIHYFFYSSQILNRIRMIYTTQSTPWYRYVLIVPVLASLFLTFACQPDAEELTQASVAQSYDEVQQKIAQIDRQLRNNPEEADRQTLLAQRDQLREKLMYLPDADGVFVVVEHQPKPIDGMPGFYQYVAQNMVYPIEAKEAEVEGKVFVQFVVNEYGQLTDLETLKGIGYGCDEEAVRVLANAPEWQPGITNGQPVNVRMVMPITFKL